MCLCASSRWRKHHSLNFSSSSVYLLATTTVQWCRAIQADTLVCIDRSGKIKPAPQQKHTARVKVEMSVVSDIRHRLSWFILVLRGRTSTFHPVTSSLCLFRSSRTWRLSSTSFTPSCLPSDGSLSRDKADFWSLNMKLQHADVKMRGGLTVMEADCRGVWILYHCSVSQRPAVWSRRGSGIWSDGVKKFRLRQFCRWIHRSCGACQQVYSLTHDWRWIHSESHQQKCWLGWFLFLSCFCPPPHVLWAPPPLSALTAVPLLWLSFRSVFLFCSQLMKERCWCGWIQAVFFITFSTRRSN